MHHIIPRAAGGTDNATNLILLTYREHYIAHWMLWHYHQEINSLCFAFYAMCNKGSKHWKKQSEYKRIINSRVYANLKADARRRISLSNKGNVYVRNSVGDNVLLTSEEYQANKASMPFHTTGMVVVRDSEGNSLWITSEEYQANKASMPFHTTGMVTVKDGEGNSLWITSEEYQANKDTLIHHMAYNANIQYAKFTFCNINTNETLLMTKSNAADLNRAAPGYSKAKKTWKQVQDSSVRTTVGSIKHSEYDRTIHTHVNKNMVRVLCTTTNKWMWISSDHFELNRHLYVTPTQGIVNVVDLTSGEKLQISQQDYDQNRNKYAGHTKGLITAKNKLTGEFIQISKDEFTSNRSKYEGPNKGKINVIHKITGQRQQIIKETFDANVHLPLGNRNYMFKCRHNKSQKQKLINIYEWSIVSTTYNIIDQKEFDKAQSLRYSTQ